MKRLFIALLAGSFLLTPAAFAQSRDTFGSSHVKERHIVRGSGVTVKKTVVITKKRWSRGHRLSVAERRHAAAVRDYRRYRLNAPPRGQQWVRSGQQFLLINTATGVIVALATR